MVVFIECYEILIKLINQNRIILIEKICIYYMIMYPSSPKEK